MENENITIRIETEDGFGLIVNVGNVDKQAEWVQVSASAPMILILAGQST